MTSTKTAAEALGLKPSDVISVDTEEAPWEGTPQEGGQEVAVKTAKMWTDEELLNLDAKTIAQTLAGKGLGVSDAGQLGNGFTLVKGDDEKRKLVGQDMYLLEWNRRTDESTGNVFYSLTILTRDNKKLIVNDGSTGIAAQLEVAEARGLSAPLRVFKGFRESRYQVEVDGTMTWASTFYLDTTPHPDAN